MKKTKQTLMTAAMFAAAVNMASYAGNGSSEQLARQENYKAEAEADVTEVYEPSSEEIQDVYGPPQTTAAATVPVIQTTTQAVPLPMYGPPWWYTTATEETATTTAATEKQEQTTTAATTTYDPNQAVEVPLYGPPPSYYIKGDLNLDGVVDVFDLVEARKRLIEGDWNDLKANVREDLNGDGQFTIADVVALSRFLTGQIKDFSEDSFPVPQPEYEPPFDME